MNIGYKYLITDPIYYKDLKQTLPKALQEHSPEYICFRDKSGYDFKEKAKQFLSIARDHSHNNVFLNSDIDLAIELGFDGVHLPSLKITCPTLGLKVIASTHNISEIELAIANNIDTITFGPVFNTPNKDKAKGIKVFADIVNKYPNLNIFALGGIISQKEVEIIAKTKSFGFASIRYFI